MIPMFDKFLNESLGDFYSTMAKEFLELKLNWLIERSKDWPANSTTPKFLIEVIAYIPHTLNVWRHKNHDYIEIDRYDKDFVKWLSIALKNSIEVEKRRYVGLAKPRAFFLILYDDKNNLSVGYDSSIEQFVVWFETGTSNIGVDEPFSLPCMRGVDLTKELGI